MWWALLWCHHAQFFLHASQNSWRNGINEWTPEEIASTQTSSSFASVHSPLPSLQDSNPTHQVLTPSLSSLAPATTPQPSKPSIPEPEQPDEEGKKGALHFLHSGNLLSLSEINCTKRYEISDLQGSPPESLIHHATRPLDYLVHATNFLNMIFQASDMRESSIREDMEWYHALVRSLAGGDPHIRRAILSFTAQPMSSKPQLLLQATKEGHEILLQDLSLMLHHARHLTDYGTWNHLQVNPSLTKAMLVNDLQSLDTPKWSRGDSYIVESNNVQWSKPFLECEGGRFSQNWMISLSTAFYGLKPDLSPEFK